MLLSAYVCHSCRPRTRWRRRYRWLPVRNVIVGVSWGCFEIECWYAPQRGMYPWRSRRLDFPNRPPVIYPHPGDLMRKKTAATPAPGGDAPKHLAPLASKLMLPLPNIVAHCCVVRYDDGDPRQPGWVQIKTQGSAWVITAKDPDSASQMQCIGNTLDDALVLADLMLGADDAPWEPDPWAKRQQAGKKK